MKTAITLLFGVLLLISIPSSMAFIIGTDVSIEPTASNTRYFSTNYTLSRLEVQNTSPYFNDNIFYIEADSGIVNVTIHSLNSMSFTITATDSVDFTLGGFTPNTDYIVQVDSIDWSNQTSSATGVIQFTYSSWSTHTFTITSEIEGDEEMGAFPPGPGSIQIPPGRRETTWGIPVPSTEVDWVPIILVVAIIIVVATLIIFLFKKS